MKNNKQESVRQDFYQIIGITTDGEVIMLDSLFDHGDGFKGACGSSFYPVTQDDIDQRNDLETVKDTYGYMWQEAVKDGSTEESLDDYMERFIRSYIFNSDGLFVGHDTSYIHHIPDSFRTEHFPDAETFECIGGGRMFDSPDKRKWKVLLRPDLLALIEEQERKVSKPELKIIK
jgi:hypothetical protein